LPRSRVVILQTPEGATLADGDLIQTFSGTRVTTRLVLRFKDGSRHEETTVLGFTPKPQLVQQEISPAGEEPFSIAGAWRKAIHYVVKVHVPGLTGVVASVFGKIPPDSHIWILGGEAPAFVAAETSLFSGGPQWRIELAYRPALNARRAERRCLCAASTPGGTTWTASARSSSMRRTGRVR